ncbi:MAG: endolytic transglycosylase MltG [Burkholderiaceae bacterium]
MSPRKILLSPLKSIARLLVLLLLIAAAAGLAFGQWANRPLAVPAATPTIEVTIAPGSSVRAIGAQLGEAHVPISPWLLVALARVERRATRLQAGTYAVTGALTPQTLLDRMEAGDVVRVTLVIPEGWTFAQMRAAVAARTDLNQTAVAMSDTQLMTAIGADPVSPEGLFFPDTYQFTRGTTDIDLYRRAYRAMQKRLADAWASRAPDLPLATPYEALTLASVVEKETGRPEDRPQVAAVFINRLRRGMLLQTDPTVIYGMGARFDGNLRKADLAADTPYNTYMHTGLPPTPIALVGAASLAAVVNPPRSDALYFVARGDGSSEFSNGLNDHNRAVDRYQRGLSRTRQ